MFKRYLLLWLSLFPSTAVFGASYYPQRLDDAKAEYLIPSNFSVHGDGKADDTEAIQQAIDKEEETNHEGVVFIPSGRYRITKTIHIWPGIRSDRLWGNPPRAGGCSKHSLFSEWSRIYGVLRRESSEAWQRIERRARSS
jgi:hypothetical protein